MSWELVIQIALLITVTGLIISLTATDIIKELKK